MFHLLPLPLRRAPEAPSPQRSGFSCWAVRRAGTWEVSGSLQPAGALVEAAEGPSCEARRGGRVPVVYNLAQGCHEQVGSRVRLDAPRVASDKKVQVPFDIQAGR